MPPLLKSLYPFQKVLFSMPAKRKAKSKVLITQDIVKHVAKVARLDLKDKEIRDFKTDLTNILKAFEVLDEINVKNVEPSFQPQPVEDVTREDKLEPCLDREKVLALSKHTQKGFYKGPKAV